MDLKGSRWAGSRPRYAPATSQRFQSSSSGGGGLAPRIISTPLTTGAGVESGTAGAITGSSTATATTTATTNGFSKDQSRQDNASAHDTQPPSQQQQQQQQRAAEFQSHCRLLRRLRWKLPALATGHGLATAPDLQHPHYAGCGDVESTEAARREAELMFKVDWFEYYALLERALLHLLGVWGIRVRRYGVGGSSNTNENNQDELQTKNEGLIGSSMYAAANAAAGHRFHANVLASLDAPANPLHACLGTGEARRQLGAAKQLRNLWKDADVADSVGGSQRLLSGYDMEQMLAAILAGFDAAFSMARAAVEDGFAQVDDACMMDIELDDAAGGSAEATTGSQDYVDDDLIMDDAMEWDGV